MPALSEMNVQVRRWQKKKTVPQRLCVSAVKFLGDVRYNLTINLPHNDAYFPWGSRHIRASSSSSGRPTPEDEKDYLDDYIEMLKEELAAAEEYRKELEESE